MLFKFFLRLLCRASSSQVNGLTGLQELATVQQAAEGARRAALQEHSDPNCQAAK